MRVVITGATSMIGVALINECVKNGDRVLAIVREGTRRLKRLPESYLIQIEFADLDNLDNVKGDGKPYDVFYHFAWGHTSKVERDLPLAQEDNIRTTLEAVELANKLGCKKFVGAGSQAEYGNYSCEITEDTVPNPTTSYGISKLSANLLSRRMCEQLDIKHIWARIFSVYGCNDNEGTMLDYAINQFIKGETASFSAATQTWNYLFESDAGRMFYLLGIKEVESGIYHVAGNESKPLRKYIEQVASKFKDAMCEFAVSGDKPVYGIEPNTDKSYKALEFEPEITFDEGIRRVIESTKKARG
ncbi:Nucleoside-diphosphate-sugar epimerase [Pseudobutyrivibrio sp. 49]|uniref:NAD-dependent epimerase/dehydratase family protein n=1 Tax=Pseudobutyrivibrio sp. 49 TaxID=1855344 RepID=UPI00087E2B08|nr:NAD(P)-dependent oxidoreductase [Pseudobutyrivibrio sp. 49]SDH60034.1 Nucleoside-diphosphate-sugar epimerase [Pseudobutyrivibrio sp. 49]